MAGAGYKLFNTGDVLTAAQVNTYLQEQVVMVFANSTARTTALSGVLAEGMVSYLKDTDALEIYSGSAWVGYGSGDITAVVAGTGLSGGATSGSATLSIDTATTVDKTTAQTLTNKTISGSSNTISNISLTTAVTGTLPIANGGTNLTTYTTGDLPYASATNTLSKLGIGTTGQVLTVASGIPSWATPASTTPSFVGAYAYASLSNNQSVADSTNTVINLDSELIDTDGFHSTSTNTGRMTIPSGKGGKYLVIGQVALGGGSGFTGTGAREIYLMKNGTTTFLFSNYPMVNTTSLYPTYMGIQFIVDLVATDYIQMMVNHNQGTSMNVRGNAYTAGSTFLAIQYLGA